MRLNKTDKAIKVFLIFVTITTFIIFYSFQLHKRPNIILIILDTLRADHLGCYGYKRDTSPNIDEFAKEGQLFSNAFSQAGYTFASIPSIFTSKTPLSHGVWFIESGNKLGENENTLAEILKKNGYTTVAFSGQGFTPTFGFAQGFDIYNKVANIEDINKSVFSWLENNRDKTFFLFIHTYTIHEPFAPPGPFNKMFAPSYRGHLKDETLDFPLFNKINKKARKGKPVLNKEDLDYIISQYDGEIRYCDRHLGELLKRIERLGLDSNTIIILTADHGEDLMEHGTISHDDIYDVGIHIPLIFRYPRLIQKNKKIDTPVRSIDILPTILNILKLPLNKDMEGSSLLPLLLGKDDKKERLIFSVAGFRKESLRLSLRTKDWKLIFTPKGNSYELFNLKNDPKELENLINMEKEHFKFLKMKLEEYLSLHNLNSAYLSKPLDEDMKRSLESLGYLQ